MSIFLLFYIIFFMHILFIADYFISGEDALTLHFFEFTQTLNYSSSVINEMIFYNISVFVLIFIGFIIGKKIKIDTLKEKSYPVSYYNTSKYISIYLIFFLLLGIIGILQNGMNYWKLNEYRESVNFLFETRIIGHLLISYYIVNGGHFSKIQKLLILVYFLVLAAFQARSMLMEAVLVFGFSYIYLKFDRIKLKYVLILIILPFIPNLFVIIRQWPVDIDKIFTYLFSFEYTLIFNMFLGAVMDSYHDAWLFGETFTPSLLLLIPSFLRSILDVNVVKSSMYTDIANEAGIFGGGFSLLAELFVNFQWLSLFYFIVIGFILGYWRKSILQNIIYKRTVTFSQAAYFLFFIAFILSFRNDIGVFLKYTIQLIIISSIMNLMLNKKRSRV